MVKGANELEDLKNPNGPSRFETFESESRWDILFKDSVNRANLLVLIASWSASAYSYYFVEFYMKLVPF